MAATMLPPTDDRPAPPPPAPPEPGRTWREWMMVGLGLTTLVSLVAVFVAIVALAAGGDEKAPARAAAPAPTAAPAAPAAAPTLADAKGVAFEKFTPVDPKLPAPPPGAVKAFKVDVYQHVTQVAKDLAPTEVWGFAVIGLSLYWLA